REPDSIRFARKTQSVAIHAHCHAKSLMDTNFMPRLVERLPGRSARLLDTGCCGMAGAFGASESKYELSLQIAQPLLARIAAQPPGTLVAASGASCRHQIEHLSAHHPRHLAEIIAEALG